LGDFMELPEVKTYFYFPRLKPSGLIF